jgi:hypothetical protein
VTKVLLGGHTDGPEDNPLIANIVDKARQPRKRGMRQSPENGVEIVRGNGFGRDAAVGAPVKEDLHSIVNLRLTDVMTGNAEIGAEIVIVADEAAGPCFAWQVPSPFADVEIGRLRVGHPGILVERMTEERNDVPALLG